MKNLNNTNNPILFSLPFGGFYESIHSENIDFQIDSQSIDWETVNYKETYKLYSKEIVDHINNHLDLDLKFIALNSPRFYNYTTDKIDCEINYIDYINFVNDNLDSAARDYIIDACKSRDGFVSFYPDLQGVKAKPEILLQYLFEYLIFENMDLNLNYLHFDIEIVINELNTTQNV